MFGVFERLGRSDQTEAETSSAFRPVIVQGRGQPRQSNSGQVRPAAEQGQSVVEVKPTAQGGVNKQT